MRGDDTHPASLFSYIQLEDRIPADHPLRVIRALIDPMLAALSPRFDALYSPQGRRSIAPEKLLRALLLQVLYTIRSERQLMEQLNYNLLFRWFVGLGIDDPVWVPTVFTKNRDRLLAGDIADAEVPPGGPPMGRWAYMRRLSEQANTYRQPRPWPQTANVACRRAAFEEVGGFRDELRAAEDADLTYRLEETGWEVERRDGAVATHVNRDSALSFARQKLVHGAGGAWLDREYPGSLPPQRLPGLVWWGTRYLVRGLCTAVRTRNRDRALWAVFRPLELIAYELGRRRTNLRP
jgi:transposase